MSDYFHAKDYKKFIPSPLYSEVFYHKEKLQRHHKLVATFTTRTSLKDYLKKLSMLDEFKR